MELSIKNNHKSLISDNMKNLIIPFAMLLMITACTKLPPAKDYTCKAWSTECELQKDRILIQPISFDSTTITDAYAYPVLIDSMHWYIVNTKAGVLAPINVQVTLHCRHTSSGPDCDRTNHPTIQQLIEKGWDGYEGNYKVDQISLSGIVPGIKDAHIIVTGPNEILAMSSNASLTKPELAKK